MDGRRPRPSIVERIGTPATVAALGLLLLIGLAVAFIAALAQSSDRADEAELSVEVVGVFTAALDVLEAVQLERGLGTLLLATRAEAERDRYSQQLGATDEALDVYEAAVLASDLPIDPADGPLGGPDRASLDRVRDAVLALQAEELASTELYRGLVDWVRRGLSDLALYSTDATELRLRRASLSLVAAADALSRRRALVTTLTAGGEPIGPETNLQLSLYAQDHALNLESAETLLIGADLARALALEGSAAASVDRMLGSFGDGSLDPVVWFDTASHQIDETMAVASLLNTEIRVRAGERLAEARRTMALTGATIGILFVLALLAGWSALAASRGRVRALKEHRQLVDGLLTWFGPEAMPEVEGVEMEARYVPAAVLSGAGGDWYDVFTLGAGRVALVVGDVSGHGSATVARMAEVRNMLRALAHADIGGPARQLEVVDASVDALHLTTVFYASLDVVRGELVYTRAGHVPGVLRRADGSTEILYHGWDTPIGVKPDGGRTEVSERIGPQDTLVLFTDGLIEAPDSDVLESIERLAADEIAPFSGALMDLANRLVRLRPDRRYKDDALVLVVRLAADSALDVHRGEQSGDLEDADHRG